MTQPTASAASPPRSGWKLRVKRFLYRLFYYSGLEFLVARCLRVNAAAVIMYHGVCDASFLPPEVDFHLPSRNFEQQVRALRRRYPVVPLRDLLDRLDRGESLEKRIVLTFDDGYRNNLTAAHPILARYSLPYAVFLSTGYVGRDAWLPLNELYGLWHFGKIDRSKMAGMRARIRSRTSAAADVLREIPAQLDASERNSAGESFAMLSWEQVCYLVAQGVEIGSHTHTHCNLAGESRERQAEELRASRERIQQETGQTPTVFAYPFGRAENWSPETRRNVIQAGYRCAILAHGGLVAPGQDVFSLPRVACKPETWYLLSEVCLLFARYCLTGR